MDKVNIIFLYTLILAGMVAFLFIAGQYVRRLPSAIVKKVNRASFILAIISGALALMAQKPIFTYILVASIVCFFLFFHYKEET